MVVVHAHFRKDKRGIPRSVRKHYRDQRLTLRLTPVGDPWRKRRDIRAYVDQDEPGVIYLNSPPAHPYRIDEVEPVISHETLHDVLLRQGEHLASDSLDTRRSSSYDIPETHGLYWYDPKLAKVVRRKRCSTNATDAYCAPSASIERS